MSGLSLPGRLHFIRWCVIFLQFFLKICETLYYMVYGFRNSVSLFLEIPVVLYGQSYITISYKHTRINGNWHLQVTTQCELLAGLRLNMNYQQMSSKTDLRFSKRLWWRNHSYWIWYRVYWYTCADISLEDAEDQDSKLLRNNGAYLALYDTIHQKVLSSRQACF